MRIKDKNKCSDLILYLFSFVIFIFIIFNAFPEIKKFLPKNSSDLAAWLQVIGSLGAVGAMLGIAIHERNDRQLDKKKKETQDLRKSALILSRTRLMNSVSFVIVRYQAYKRYQSSSNWKKFWFKYPMIYLLKMTLDSVKKTRERLDAIGVSSYDELMLGAIGIEFQRLVVNIEYLSGVYEDFSGIYNYSEAKFNQMNVTSDEAYLREVELDLQELEAFAKEAINELIDSHRMIQDKISHVDFD